MLNDAWSPTEPGIDFEASVRQCVPAQAYDEQYNITYYVDKNGKEEC